MGFLKQQVHNRAHPEGSIAENYIGNECLTFASRYLRGVETRLNRPSRNLHGEFFFPLGTERRYSTMKLEAAHAYVLNNLEMVTEYRR